MKCSLIVKAIVVGTLVVAVAGLGNALAQCGTAAGCGDANCSSCATTADTQLTAIPLGELTPEELKFVKFLADQVEKSKRVEYDLVAFSKATGLSQETIMGFDQDRIQGGLMAELNARGFDTSELAFQTGGGNCGEFGACSVDRNLMGASGELLEAYEEERSSDGQSYLAWKAPDFTLPATDGTEVSLSDYLGKPVAVAILAMHCNHCVDMAPMLSKLKDKYSDELVILPVVTNASSIDGVKSWADALKLDYPLLVSTDKAVAEQFNAELVPTIVLVNSKGYVTKKLITFKDETKLDLAFAELVSKSQEGSSRGSR